MRFRLLAMILICSFILLWNQQAFADFQESDLQGEWKAFISVTDLTNVVISNATYKMNQKGNFLSGTTLDDAQFVSGNFDIESEGLISGNYETTSTNIHIEKAKMNNNKNLINGVYSSDANTFGWFMYVKTTNNAHISDLSGKWKLIDFGSDGTVEELGHGFVEFNDSGNIVDSSIEYMDSSTNSFTTSSISVTQEGKIMGTAQGDSGVTTAIMSGQITSDKNLIVIYYYTDINTYGLTYLVKYGGTFQETDLAAKWHGTTIEGTSVNDLSINYDFTKLNSDGNLVDSYYKVIDGTSGKYTSASLNLNTQGEITGTVVNDKGGESTLVAGKMSPSKDIGIYAFETDYGSVGGGIYIKGQELSSNGTPGNGGGSKGCFINTLLP